MRNKLLRFPALVLAALVAATFFLPVSCGTSPGYEVPSELLDTASVIGEGQTSFTFSATLADGSTKVYTVKTDESLVGEALLSVGLIKGSQSEYGLYVDTVCGERHLYEEDGKFWAFYIDGEMAMSGVDTTEIEPGHVYGMRAE